MKEPITGRDLFVISTLCTSFGVLLAWGLFYQWGSAPDPKAFDAPAWAQAIGSLAGIAIAIYVPWRQRRDALTDEAKRNRDKIMIMASALRPAIEDLRATLVSVRDFSKMGFEVRQQMKKSHLVRHPEFDQFRPELHLFGALGLEISASISDQQYFLDAIEVLSTEQEPPPNFVEIFDKNVEVAIRRSSHCVTELSKVSRENH